MVVNLSKQIANIQRLVAANSDRIAKLRANHRFVEAVEYLIQYAVGEDGVGRFAVEEDRSTQEVLHVIAEWRPQLSLSPLTDYFDEQIDLQPVSFDDLFNLNEE